MAKLIYIAITSLDGYIEDESGRFDWSVPDEEVHTFVNDLLRPVGTYLYGRRIYETMVVWETMDTAPQAPFMRDFAEIWRAADKIVFSKTLEKVSSARKRGSSETSTRKRSGAQKCWQDATSRWLEPASPPMRSRPGWWTSTT